MTKEEAKELVERIFGKEASNDEDIVDFYFNVNSVAIDQYAKQECIKLLKWWDKTEQEDNHIFNYEQFYESYLQSKNKQ